MAFTKIENCFIYYHGFKKKT
uniref:Uncharacterized protein n=1 Tax=Arundo donax TaxID=35708 RepID=A0A0A8XU73_ARUDO